MLFSIIKALIGTRIRRILVTAGAALIGVGFMLPAQAARHAASPAAKTAILFLPHHRASAKISAGEVPADVIQAIQAAQRKVQANPLVLLAIAWQESRFDAKARNRHSSACGLLQFTTSTWLTVIRDFGARHGLAHYAAAIHTGHDGALSVETAHLRRAMLALRENPKLEALLAAEQLAQQRTLLEAQLGRTATAPDIYVLHLLGLTGATDFLTQLAAKPDLSSLDVVGSALKPNRALFVRDGRILSIAEAYAGIRATLTEQASQHAALFVADPVSPDPDVTKPDRRIALSSGR